MNYSQLCCYWIIGICQILSLFAHSVNFMAMSIAFLGLVSSYGFEQDSSGVSELVNQIVILVH